MPPVFFVSLPCILLLMIFRATGAKAIEAKPTKPSIEDVIEFLNSQDDEIIIVRKKKH